MIWFYRIIFVPAFLALFPYYALRMIKRGGYSKDFLHRLGRQNDLPKPDANKKRIWIQAVSVGEVEAIAPLLKSLFETNKVELVVTTTTSTAYKILREKYSKYCYYCAVFPMDFAPFSNSAWDKIKPDLCILMEGELWPEHMYQAKKRGVKILLINARLSDKSYSRYLKIKFISKPLLSWLYRVYASSQTDMQRFIDIGVAEDKISNTGNIKFDAVLENPLSEFQKEELKESFGFEKNSFVLLGSSTWQGEEEMLVLAMQKIRSKNLDCRLLIIPRHAERRAQIKDALSKFKENFWFRSESKTALKNTLIYVADTTGEARMLTQVADLAFIGKSMPPHDGGQTPLDAASASVCITYGPKMTNFRLMCKTLETSGAAIKTQNPEEEIELLIKLAFDDTRRRSLANAAKVWHTSNLGSVQKIHTAIFNAL